MSHAILLFTRHAAPWIQEFGEYSSVEECLLVLGRLFGAYAIENNLSFVDAPPEFPDIELFFNEFKELLVLDYEHEHGYYEIYDCGMVQNLFHYYVSSDNGIL